MNTEKNQGAGQEVDRYIEGFDPFVQERLRAVRSIILETVPGCEEKLSWGAPTYYLNGYLLQFAAYKKHLGFYTTPATLKRFQEELSGYKTNEKNTVQFPHDGELPCELIRKMTAFRLEEKSLEEKRLEDMHRKQQVKRRQPGDK